MQDFSDNITSLDGWFFYRPNRLVEEGVPHLNVYGVVFSTTDMTDFQVLVNLFRAIEIEKPFQHQHDLPFNGLVTLDMRDWSPSFIDNIAKQRKVHNLFL